jgi:hypothetical protein
MSSFLVWTITVIAFAVAGLVVFAIIRATGKSREASIRDAQAQRELGANPRPENQNGYVTPYRS